MKNEKKILVSLRLVTAAVVITNVICGIAGIVAGKDYFFVGESVWVLAGFALMLLHAWPTLGGRVCVIGGVATAFLSLFFEACGCNFGWFFTKYVYTSYIPGPKLFGFNVYSMIAYGMGMFIIWETVRSLVGQYGKHLTKQDLIMMPVLSSFLLVTVDYATDPFLSTVNHTHIWEKPGVYYGIPWQNYLGWYLMAYVFYLFLALLIYHEDQKNRLPETPSVSSRKEFWIYPPLLYASLWIQMPFYAAIQTDLSVTVESTGQTYLASQIYWGVMIIMIGAMVTPAFAAVERVLRDPRLK